MTNPLIDKWNEIQSHKTTEMVDRSKLLNSHIELKGTFNTPTNHLKDEFLYLIQRVKGGSAIVTNIEMNANPGGPVRCTYTIEIRDYG